LIAPSPKKQSVTTIFARYLMAKSHSNRQWNMSADNGVTTVHVSCRSKKCIEPPRPREQQFLSKKFGHACVVLYREQARERDRISGNDVIIVIHGRDGTVTTASCPM